MKRFALMLTLILALSASVFAQLQPLSTAQSRSVRAVMALHGQRTAAALTALPLAPLPTLPAPPTGHYMELLWIASTDGAANPTLAYNLYRGTAPGGESSSSLNASPVAAGCNSTTATGNGTTPCYYYDATATTVGQQYCYVVKSILNGALSGPSNEACAVIPPAPPTGDTAIGN